MKKTIIYLALGAFIALSLCACGAAQESSAKTSQTEQTTNTSAAITTTETSAVEESINAETTTTTTEVENPSGGEAPELRLMNYHFTCIESFFSDNVDLEKFTAWLDLDSHSERPLTQNADGILKEKNMYTFIKYFNISDEDMRKYFKEYNEACVKLNIIDEFFSDEDINLMLGDDVEAAMEQFADEHAIYKNGILYSAKWMYEKDIAEYTKAGIEPTDVLAKIDAYKDIKLRLGDCTEFEKKLSEFCGQTIEL